MHTHTDKHTHARTRARALFLCNTRQKSPKKRIFLIYAFCCANLLCVYVRALCVEKYNLSLECNFLLVREDSIHVWAVTKIIKLPWQLGGTV